jgi:hypothetical protein
MIFLCLKEYTSFADEVNQKIDQLKQGTETVIATKQSQIDALQTQLVAETRDNAKDKLQDKIDALREKISTANSNLNDKIEAVLDKNQDKLDAVAPLYSDFTFSTKTSKTVEHSSSNSYEVRAGISYGLWSVSSGVSGGDTAHDISTESSDVVISGQIGFIQVVRPWFDPSIFSLRGWSNSAYDKGQISDGTGKQGILPMYTTALIVVKDLSIESEFASSQLHESSWKVNVDLTVGYGPFKFGPKYSHESADKSVETKGSKTKITNKGAIIIGYANTIVPFCPQEDSPQKKK